MENFESLYLFLPFVFVIGVCIGSFLNVVILRALRDESIVAPASKCPVCQTPLKPQHNIPIISYICLRGRCAFCHEKISPQYPLVELITGLLFVFAALKFGINIQTPMAWVALSLFIVIAGTDFRERLVFTRHTHTLLVLGVLHSLIAGSSVFLLSSLLGILAGIAIMEIAARSGYLFAGTRAFGEGDTYIAAALGAVFGWKELLIVLALSLAVQLVFTIPVFVKKLFLNKDYKTLVTSAVFCIYALVYFFTETNNVPAALIFAALGIYLCRLVLTGLKETTPTYLPFGPAMVIAGTILLLV